jgi:hypothetical protein
LIHHMSGMPLGLLLFFILNNLFDILCPSILLTCQNYISLLLLGFFCISSWALPVICVSDPVSHLFFPLTSSNFISAACSLLFCLLEHVHVSAEYSSIFWKYTLSTHYIYSVCIFIP